MAPSELRVDVEDQDENKRFAVYDKFHVDTEASKYRLTLGSYRGNANDAMTYHSGQKFSTRDQDNDEHSTHCAQEYLGAWWYKSCQFANLNGEYDNSNYAQGLSWKEWRGYEHSMMTTSMKLRRIA
ncbi:PREDICTED: ficolin-1-like [Priapulus caudatus]|uniref:Ficolin-1-like n=1 Tax=Priapulus caudatus TaxID=37621 RepID=A0ABM1F851_PRICU|nr:PREDICTED: ficolin-1-like [Priapulus caudatus]